MRETQPVLSGNRALQCRTFPSQPNQRESLVLESLTGRYETPVALPEATASLRWPQVLAQVKAANQGSRTRTAKEGIQKLTGLQSLLLPNRAEEHESLHSLT